MGSHNDQISVQCLGLSNDRIGTPAFHNLLFSLDGNFWTAVDPNDLVTPFTSLGADPNKNLMVARGGSAYSGEGNAEFSNGGYWLSDDDGETWAEFGDRSAGNFQFIDLKIGPVVDETLFIDTGPIVISDVRNE